MASPEPLAPRVSAFDVLGFTDAELIEFMQQSRRPGDGGGFDLDIDGWHTLEGDQKDKFAERLRFGARKALESTPSRPVDLDQVTARLLEAVTATTTETRRYPTTDPPPTLQEEQELQRKYHDMLVSDGGRPCYPIALVQAFSENIDAYPGLAEPWLRNGWEVFDIQLDHWHRFLQWQQLNRETYDSDAAYVRYARKYKLLWDFYQSPEAQKLEANPLHLMEHWKRVQARESHDWQPLAHGDNLPPILEGPAFLTYLEVVKCRLAQHGVTRTAQLKEDVKQQDKLSTWLEYLAYQYAWCDRYARQLKRRQVRFDKDWERLVASGVLHDWETADYLDTDASGFERQDEDDTAHVAMIRAEKAVKALEAEIEKSKQGPGKPRLQELERSLAEAKSKESSARQAYKVVMARHDPIDRFLDKAMNYRETQHNIQKNGELAQWILDQLPLVETELSDDRNPESSPSPAPAPASLPAARQTPSPQPAHDAGRKTRSGRVTKKSAQSRTDARSPRSGTAQAGASPPSGPRPRRRDPEINTGAGSVVQPCKGQRKVYQKERASRRLAGQLPEFGMLPDRGEPAPLVEAPPRDSPRTGTTRKPAPRGKKLSQAQAERGGKPRGVSKSRPRSLRQGIRRSLA